MGFQRKKYNFTKVNVNDISDEEFYKILEEIEKNDYDLLAFYKDVVAGRVSWQYLGGFEQLQKDVIERYGEQYVKECVKSEV